MDIVECHSGAAYGERPLAFTWEGNRLLVKEVLSQGRTPTIRWFRVRSEDGQAFELSCNDETGEWQIKQL